MFGVPRKKFLTKHNKNPFQKSPEIQQNIYDMTHKDSPIIGHSRILLLFNNEVHRTKESEIFDAIMVAYDKAVVYKLIGTFLFRQLSQKFDKEQWFIWGWQIVSI